MTPAQLAVFRLIADGKVSMFCDKCVWRFRDDMGDAINRRTIDALENRGLVSFMWFRDGAGISLTEAGRHRAAVWDRNRRRTA